MFPEIRSEINEETALRSLIKIVIAQEPVYFADFPDQVAVLKEIVTEDNTQAQIGRKVREYTKTLRHRILAMADHYEYELVCDEW